MEKLPEDMLMWTLEHNGETKVVAVTTGSTVEIGQRVWNEKLQRWGRVTKRAPACVYVECEN